MAGLFFDFVKTSFKTWGLPSFVGKAIYENPSVKATDFVWRGYHATRFARIQDQLAQGKFDNRDLHIYLSWHPFSAAEFHRGGTNRDCVLLEIASNFKPRRNPLYGTYYFPKGSQQDVTICKVYSMAEEFFKYRNLSP